MRTARIFGLLAILVFVGFQLASAATGTEGSDPYFRELNALKARLGTVERRVGGVERGLKATNEAVSDLAGRPRPAEANCRG